MNKKLLTILIKVWKTNVRKYLGDDAIRAMQDEIDITLLINKFDKEAGSRTAFEEASDLLGDRLVGQIVNAAKDLYEEMEKKGLSLNFFELYPDETLDLEEIFKELDANYKAVVRIAPGYAELSDDYEYWINQLNDPDLGQYCERN